MITGFIHFKVHPYKQQPSRYYSGRIKDPLGNHLGCVINFQVIPYCMEVRNFYIYCNKEHTPGILALACWIKKKAITSIDHCVSLCPVKVFLDDKLFNELTGGNWQKWKRVFLTCPCHEIYRNKAVGLKSCKNTWKITIFVKMWNLGQFRENLIFCQ